MKKKIIALFMSVLVGVGIFGSIPTQAATLDKNVTIQGDMPEVIIEENNGELSARGATTNRARVIDYSIAETDSFYIGLCSRGYSTSVSVGASVKGASASISRGTTYSASFKEFYKCYRVWVKWEVVDALGRHLYYDNGFAYTQGYVYYRY